MTAPKFKGQPSITGDALTMYQLLPNDFMGRPAQCIKRIADNAFIPFDPANMDYQEYLEWLAEGNEPEPAPVPTTE